jgi:hypothetical protein
MSAVDKIRAELAAITPTPWKGASVPSGRKYGVIGTTDEKGRSYALAVFSAVPAKHRHADTQFVAHAPVYVAALCDVADALRLIMGDRCQTFTSGLGTCITSGRTKDAKYTAERWCDSCIAFDALNTLDEAVK